MKNSYILALAFFATSGLFAQDANDTLSFESFDLGTNEYYNGTEGTPNITIGNITLSNTFSEEEWGESWEGFAISKIQDVTSIGAENQYASFANGGAESSEKYGIYNTGFAGPHTIELPTQYVFKSLQVTNTTYAALSMRDGDGFGKQFGSPNDAAGSPDGTNGEDWFLLQVIPLNDNDELVGDTIDFYLADFRFADNNEDYILNTWETIDLGNVVAKKLAFKLSSSDIGDWGMNTPAFFAIDNLVASPTVGVESVANLNVSVYPNPAKDVFRVQTEQNVDMELYSSFGQLITEKKNVNEAIFDVNKLPAGIYFLNLQSASGKVTQKIVVQ